MHVYPGPKRKRPAPMSLERDVLVGGVVLVHWKQKVQCLRSCTCSGVPFQQSVYAVVTIALSMCFGSVVNSRFVRWRYLLDSAVAAAAGRSTASVQCVFGNIGAGDLGY